MLFEPPEHANVREAARAATAQRNADAWARLLSKRYSSRQRKHNSPTATRLMWSFPPA